MNRLISAVIRVESVCIKLPVASVGNCWKTKSEEKKTLQKHKLFLTCISFQLRMEDVVDFKISLRLFSRLFRPISGDEIISAWILQNSYSFHEISTYFYYRTSANKIQWHCSELSRATALHHKHIVRVGNVSENELFSSFTQTNKKNSTANRERVFLSD